MFESNAMISFNTLNDFQQFYDDFDFYGGWRITDSPINERGNLVRNSSYIILLRELFNRKHLFRRSVSIGELVSFVDNYYLLYKLIDKLKKRIPEEKLKKARLYSEYRVFMSKNRRVDFIFEYEDKLLLLEFRISNTFPNISNIWQKKEAELLIYKELLSNYLPDDKEIFIYAFIGMPEYQGNKRIIKHAAYNENNLEHLAKYIDLFIFQKRGDYLIE